MSWFFVNVLVPILVIGVLVVVHEFGHFIVAKWCGVGVLRFAVGFGPAIWRFRRLETEYQIGIIPLGGFVRMVGDMPDNITGSQATDQAVRDQAVREGSQEIKAEIPEEVASVISDRRRWFIEKNLWQRSAIVVAGPLFNMVFAVLVVFACVWYYGKQVQDDSTVVGSVVSGSPAEKAGLRADDKILSVDSKQVNTASELAAIINGGTGSAINLLVERSGEQILINAQPQQKTVTSITGETKSAYFIGIGFKFKRVASSFTDAIKMGFLWTWDKTMLTTYGIWGMITGEISPKELASPIYIVQAVGSEAERGLENIFYFTALLSVSLGVLNLLPIPILDGGHLLFFFLEALIGPISIRKKEFAQQVGMVLLLLLMGFAIKNDIYREAPKKQAELKWEDEEKKDAASKQAAAAPDSVAPVSE